MQNGEPRAFTDTNSLPNVIYNKTCLKWGAKQKPALIGKLSCLSIK